MNTEHEHTESGQSPPAEVRESKARASRIHSLLKLRDKAEAEIAALLREHLDAVGEPTWREWCEREFGWKRRAAYNHLNPEQLQKDRERAEEQRADRLHIAEPVEQGWVDSDSFFQAQRAIETPTDPPTSKPRQSLLRSGARRGPR